VSPHHRPRQLRRRKALRLDHAALHDHDHAQLRGTAVVAVLVALVMAGVWRRDATAPDISVEAASAQGSSPAVVRTTPDEAESPVGADYLPLVTVAPEYPVSAQAAGIGGRCTVEFTVTAAGTTRDVRPVDCDPPGVFEGAAVAAARQFKYRPRERAGQPVEMTGIRNEFLFSLER
jgi:TonB family protein